MEIGYACLTVGVAGTKLKSCRKSKADDETLKAIIQHNLQALNAMLNYNIQRDIRLLRISSDIIPFGSHPINSLKWREIFADELSALGQKAKEHHIRLSMHPGQYTVLNSPHEDVAARAAEDLRYHTRFLDALGMDSQNKIVLHIGGAYGNKKAALARFAENYKKLQQNIRDRLLIENDDKIFNIKEVLELGRQNEIPVVFDNLHNQINPFNSDEDASLIRLAADTWKTKDGRPCIHYSQQARGKKPGAHSDTIDLAEFSAFARNLEEQGLDVDIMLEVKDKNLSAVKCVNALKKHSIKELEEEWARYKYLVLEHDPAIYQQIRELLKDKKAYPVTEFYRLIDEALSRDVKAGTALNAAQHVWGYFKSDADDKTKKKISRAFKNTAAGASLRPLKRILWKLACEQDEKYLLESLYFREII